MWCCGFLSCEERGEVWELPERVLLFSCQGRIAALSCIYFEFPFVSFACFVVKV